VKTHPAVFNWNFWAGATWAGYSGNGKQYNIPEIDLVIDDLYPHLKKHAHRQPMTNK